MHLLLRSRLVACATVVAAGVGVAAAVLPAAPDPVQPSSRTGLGEQVESVRVERAQDRFPGAGSSTALVVWERQDGRALSGQDLAGVARAGTVVAELAEGGRVPPPQASPDGTVALVPVPLPEIELGGAAAEEAVVAAVDELRDGLDDAAPDGVQARVTGGPAFAADLTRVFDGADTRLLLATAAVVALLLFATYRSPVLVVVPLVVVGATEQAAAALAGQLLPRLDLPGGGGPTGIASVLVFGAATDYALLLIARYREQLRTVPDALVAMRTALTRTGEAVLASGGTVLVALSVLLLTGTEQLRAIAVSCMIGVALAVPASLVVLPAALALLGRRAFWPLVPRIGSASADGRVWGRLAGVVARRPARILVVSALVVGALAAPALSLQTGLTQNEQFRTPPEAVTAAQRLADALPAGATEPLAVITDQDDAQAVTAAALRVDGVVSAAPGQVAGGQAQVDVLLEDEPGSDGSRASVADLRGALDDVGDGRALVGGGAAERVDVRATNATDRLIVIPLVLVLVGLVLAVLLRSLLAPLLLVVTVVASYAASLGASWLLFDRVLGYPALDDAVVVLSFLFLVALGVDYNIFLTTRAREEAVEHGTRAGMLRALTVTGGVITSAGLLLAAVFAVLGVLPLILLTQLGVIVCVGVLVDTLLVRTVIVPALALLLGERFWWPDRPGARGTDPAAVRRAVPQFSSPGAAGPGRQEHGGRPA